VASVATGNTGEFPENESKKPKTFGLALKNQKQFLAIDTDTINKEFDIGGEKGRKLVDESEEEERNEQEILELAEHCVLAMAEHSPSEPIMSKYAMNGGIRSPPAGLFGSYHCYSQVNIDAATKIGAGIPTIHKERKQFTFCLDNLEAGAATPIKEESLMTSNLPWGATLFI
jgi:hypothetical protein